MTWAGLDGVGGADTPSGAWGGASLSCEAAGAGSCRTVPGTWQVLTQCVLK